MQPQGHVQLLMNLLLRGMDPQAAIDAPRFCIRNGVAGGAVALESWLPSGDGDDHHHGEHSADGGHEGKGGGKAVAVELGKMGHNIVLVEGHARAEMGRAQVRSLRVMR